MGIIWNPCDTVNVSDKLGDVFGQFFLSICERRLVNQCYKRHSLRVFFTMEAPSNPYQNREKTHTGYTLNNDSNIPCDGAIHSLSLCRYFSRNY